MLNNLLDFSTKALLPSNTNYTPEFRKAAFIFIALEIADKLFSGNNRALDRVLNLALGHALLLALYLDPDSVLGHSDIHKLLRELDLNLNLFDDLERDLHRVLERDFDHEMVNKIITQSLNYLTGSLLIVQCLNSATYLSESAREDILKDLLSPLTDSEKEDMQTNE